MSVVLQLKGRLAELRQKDMSIVIKGKSLADAIKDRLAASSIMPLRDIDADGIAALAGELKKAHDEHLKILEDMAGIERELGN